MRLGDYLSKTPSIDYEQVDKFLGKKSPSLGTPRKINIGQVACNFYCKKCNDTRTFLSPSNIQMVRITKSLISIDTRLACSACKVSVPAWFLVDIEGDIMSQAPKVRLIKRIIRYTEDVHPSSERYGEYSGALEKAQRAFEEDLGAGAIIYLRKVFETITYRVADENSICICDKNNKIVNFREVLNRVCKRKPDFIPQEFSEDGYRLFGELSNVVHGEFDENEGISKYPALFRLVQGILDNRINSEEMTGAKARLWG